jgi:hypothetical protein
VTQPESIVAITFTRKAAAEMRARILAALEESPEGLDRWDLRSNPARLRIQTIDSLCASIVQCMPWMARTGGMPSIVEDAREPTARPLNIRLRTSRGRRGGRAALLHLDNNYRTVQAMFEDLLPRRDQWLRHVGVGAGGGAFARRSKIRWPAWWCAVLKSGRPHPAARSDAHCRACTISPGNENFSKLYPAPKLTS